MRSRFSSFFSTSLLALLPVLLVGGCTLVTDVDREKIPAEAFDGGEPGGQGGTGGAAADAAADGAAGSGGEPDAAPPDAAPPDGAPGTGTEAGPAADAAPEAGDGG